MTLARCLGAASALALIAGPALAFEERIESQHYAFEVEAVAEGLVHPWGMAFLPDGRYLVTERNPGTIRVGSVEDGLRDAPVLEVEELFRPEGPTPLSQAGIFDLVLHPDFDDNGYVYWVYSRATDRGAALVIQRGVWNADEDALSDVEDVWVMDEESQDSSGVHFGGRLLFADDGTLHLTIGDRYSMDRAQDLEDQAGSTLRMTNAGEVPDDNPEWDEATNEYLYTAGQRNIQAIAVHPETGAIWAIGHGPLGGDEINLIVGGENYGWPLISGGPDYSGAPLGAGLAYEGMVSPEHVFEETVAPSGATFVRDDDDGFEAWQGDLLIGGLVAEGVVRVRFDQDGAVVEEEWIEIGRRIRDVHVHDGALWVLTEHEDGELMRLTPGASASAGDEDADDDA
jgi:aldose sugar dehydrogenase